MFTYDKFWEGYRPKGCCTVNRLFSEEAIRLQWRQLENPEPLIRLLPSDALTTQKSKLVE